MTPRDGDHQQADVQLIRPAVPGYSADQTETTATLDIAPSGSGQIQHTFIVANGTQSRVALTYIVDVMADGTTQIRVGQVTGQCGR